MNLILCGVGVLSLAGMASAQVSFYENDLASFLNDLGGAVQLGVTEDFENHTQEDDMVEVLNNPLAGGVPNGSFTSGLQNLNLSVVCNDANGDGQTDLVLLTDGFAGDHTSVVGSDIFSDTTSIRIADDLFGISVELWSLTFATTFDISVFDSDDNLIGMQTITVSEPTSLGIISQGHDIAEVLVAAGDDNGELVDNITMYVIPSPAAPALLGIVGLTLLRRHR